MGPGSGGRGWGRGKREGVDDAGVRSGWEVITWGCGGRALGAAVRCSRGAGGMRWLWGMRGNVLPCGGVCVCAGL